MGKEVAQTYEEIVEAAPKIGQFFHKGQWEIMQLNNKALKKGFEKLWKSNLRKNCQGLFQKHRTINVDCLGIGLNKATIAIGAGSSFNKNKEFLKELYFENMKLPFNEQPFVFFASNHMYKPLLEMGIAPHFIMLCEGSDVVYDQLCKDIPKHGRGSILVCPVRAHNKVLKEWDRQGRLIKFYMGDNEWMMAEFEKVMGFHPKKLGIVLSHGGNVLNQIFTIAVTYLHSSVYICVGNDLSYPYHEKLDDRRATYYADGDYSSNLATGRDEALRYVPWMGYTLEQSILDPTHYHIKFEPRATTGQLLMYKLWVENQMTIQEKWKKRFHYYNCTEGGILGVLSKKDPTKVKIADAMVDPDNWYLLDEVIPQSYHTTTLTEACNNFLIAREKLKEEQCQTQGAILTGANDVTILHRPMVTARLVGQ